MKKPGIFTGALIGALLTAPLIAVFYLAWKLFGLPFAPFNIFDWVARILPGPVVTFGIDSLVSTIRSLGFTDTAETAKTAEQLMAVAIFLIAGIVAGAILFAVLCRLKKSALRAGIIFGVINGVIVLIIGLSLARTTNVNPILGGVWIIAMFLVWGALLGWTYNRFRGNATNDKAEKDSVEQVNRRNFLIKLGGATASVTVIGAVVGSLVGGRRETSVATNELWSASNILPNAGADVLPVPGTRPEFTPLSEHYRIDINTTLPTINGETWRLNIGGLVEKPLQMTIEQIRRYEPLHQFVTLECISNPIPGDLIGTTRWTGVSLQKLLPEWGLKPNATHLKISSADGFWETAAVEKIMTDPRVMLCYAWDGVPLLDKHGFPLRIYIPDVYGMNQPKWIESIEAMDHWEPGYWVVRGWSREAQIDTTSIIDTVAIGEKFTGVNGQTLVPVGGIAFAGARGISKVEVQVDEGEWQAAQLRAPISEKTWVVWRYEFPFQQGEHTFTVRSYDGSGTLQIREQTPPHPDGATSWHSTKISL